MSNNNQEQAKLLRRILIPAAVILVALVVFALTNPFSFNDAGSRTVVTQTDGHQFVQYKAGLFYAGFFSKEQEWPNQISVSYRDSVADLGLTDNTSEVGFITIMFSDATSAKAAGITQYVLPTGETEMLAIHNTHKTPEALVQRRLGPYTMECLQNSAQLMSSEMHYGGGRAQMAQDYLDQLKNGAFLLNVQETNIYDTLEKTQKKVYQVEKQRDEKKQFKRKFSSIKEYGVTVADAQIVNVDYEAAVKAMLQKKIKAATDASVSRQELMTAQQKKLTSEAQGQQKLVEIEYVQKQEQTKQVVAAETQVELARQDLKKQDIALQASYKEAQKIKTLADAEAYSKQRVIQADGALTQKLEAYKEVQGYWAEAFGKYQGNITPQFVTGGGYSGGNGGINFMEIMGAKAAKDLSLDLNTSRK